MEDFPHRLMGGVPVLDNIVEIEASSGGNAERFPSKVTHLSGKTPTGSKPRTKQPSDLTTPNVEAKVAANELQPSTIAKPRNSTPSTTDHSDTPSHNKSRSHQPGKLSQSKSTPTIRGWSTWIVYFCGSIFIAALAFSSINYFSKQQFEKQMKLLLLEQLNKEGGRVENRLLALELLAEMDGNTKIQQWAKTQLKEIQQAEEFLVERFADSDWALQMEHFGWPVDRDKIRTEQIAYEDYRRGVQFKGKLGDPITAADDGTVIYSGQGIKGYGNLILIRHSEDLMSVYAHNYANYVNEGDLVKRNQLIGVMGEDPMSKKASLYFEVRYKGKAEDPFNYLRW